MFFGEQIQFLVEIVVYNKQFIYNPLKNLILKIVILQLIKFQYCIFLNRFCVLTNVEFYVIFG